VYVKSRKLPLNCEATTNRFVLSLGDRPSQLQSSSTARLARRTELCSFLFVWPRNSLIAIQWDLKAVPKSLRRVSTNSATASLQTRSHGSEFNPRGNAVKIGLHRLPHRISGDSRP
jgi:hypothetical protein